MDRIQLLKSNFDRRRRFYPNEAAFDIVFVLNVNSRGWILHKICRVIADNSGLHCKIVFSERNDTLTNPLPSARAYFFGHYAIAFFAMLKEPKIFSARRYLWFTHPDPNKGVSFDELIAMANVSDGFFVPNSGHRTLLTSLGAPPEKVTLVLGGADPELFRTKKRGGGKVAFAGAYYPRKNPDLVLETISANPDMQFLLLAAHPDEVTNKGILWSAWERYDELLALSNLTVIEAMYEDFPRYFEEIDTLVSLSNLEGGPIPLIEALMTNANIIATDTGFARDIIKQERNGWLLPIEATVEQVSDALNWAKMDNDTDVATEVRSLMSWKQFGLKIAQTMFPGFTPGMIDYSQDGGGEAFLQGGWAKPDRTGVLSDRRQSWLELPSGSDAAFIARRFYIWRGDGAAQETIVHIGNPNCDVRQYLIAGGVPQIISHVSTSRNHRKRMLLENTSIPPTDTRYKGIKIGWVESERVDGMKAGDTIKIGSNSLGRFFLESGWHSVEQEGVWSAYADARLVIPLAEELQRGDFSFEISGRPFATKKSRSNRVEICLSQHGIERIEKVPAGQSTMSIKVPKIQEPTETLIVQITGGEFKSPADIDPAASDKRNLGYYLSSISVSQ